MAENHINIKLFTLTLIGIIFMTSSTTAFTHRQVFGQLIVEGNYGTVLMNGETITDERTISSATEIVTSLKSSARVSFGEAGQIGLATNSKMNLEFNETKITGVLTKGQLRMAVAPNIKISIKTADGVVTNPDQSKNSIVVVDFANGRTRVKTELGIAALNGVVVKEGQIFSSGKPTPAKQTENAGIFSDILTSLAKAMYIDELLGWDSQAAIPETTISASVRQVNVGPKE